MRTLALSLAGAAGKTVRGAVHGVRWLPGIAGAGLLTTAGALVHPVVGFAVAGVFCLALDWRLR